MIVTGQHSFPFSSSEELLPAGIMPDTGGLAFAEMLKQTDGHCDITLDQNQNRNLELFNESILNESESYRVVVSGNGEVETEKKVLRPFQIRLNRRKKKMRIPEFLCLFGAIAVNRKRFPNAVKRKKTVGKVKNPVRKSAG